MNAIEFINKVLPEHERTSCSDEDLNNGLYSRNEKGSGRCTKCIFLQIAKGREIPKEMIEEGIIAFLG